MSTNKMYEVFADMGSIRIESNGVAFFFNNGCGDGKHAVVIGQDNRKDREYGWNYEGLFEVDEKGQAELKDYDCGGNTIHVFRQGRYPVWSNDGAVYIGKWD